MRNMYTNLCGKISILLVLFLSSVGLNAQVAGVKTIPSDYASIAAFVADINTQGVGAGGVTLIVPSGYTETAPNGGYLITASGTLTDQIIISGETGGTIPLITASSAHTVGALNDAIFKIQGGDFITISNLRLTENNLNTVTAAASNNMTEWGIALIYATTTNGAQNCTIRDNVIELNRTYQNTFGIYSNSTHALGTVSTTATATTSQGGNSGLKIYGNAISNVNLGIVVVGPTAAADHNDGVDIGGVLTQTGNTITNFGSTGTFSAYANVSGTVNGILVRNSKNVNISYNTITSSAGGVTAGTLNGIQIPSFSSAPTGTFTQTVNNNTISLNSGVLAGTINGINIGGTSASVTSTIQVNNNNFINFDHTPAGATGSVTFITQGGTHQTQSISNNTFTNITLKTTGSVTFISNSHTLPSGGVKNVNNNSIVTAFNKLGAGGTITLFTDNGSDPAGTVNNSNGNNFSNITVTGATTISGFGNTNGGSPTKSVSNNVFTNWNGGTSAITALSIGFSGTSQITNNLISNITSSGAITGISNSSGSGTENFSNNTVHTLTTTGASAVIGISVSSGTRNVFNNKIYNLTANNAGGTVSGIQVAGGTLVNVYNNLISDLKSPIGTSATNADLVRGISITSTTTLSNINVYYNSIYLNATSTGANFSTAGIFHTTSAIATTAALDLRNNIIINESVPNGTGTTVAFRRSGTGFVNYASTSNRNLFYAGAPSTSSLIFSDGTTPQQTIAGYQTAVAPRDANSFTGESFTYGTPGSFFISLTPTSADFLRPVAGITTLVESGAINITSPAITTDYSNTIRGGNTGYTGTGTAPDVGAYEFNGISPAPSIVLNSVTPPTTASCSASSRLVSLTITTPSGTITGATLNYSFNGVAQTPISMTNTSGNIWEGTIPVGSPLNATVTWNVVATNSLPLNSTYIGTTYSDEPLTGVSGVVASNISTVCSGDPSVLTASLVKPGTIVAGSGGGTSSSSAQSPFYHGYGGVKTQYIYRASELTAIGLGAGPITSMSLNITSLGTPTLNSFTIDMGHTSQNAAVTNTAILNNLTQVYSNAAQTLTAGVNTYVLSTPFVWDGVSNVVISFNYSNLNAGGTSSTVTTNAAASFTTSLAIFADNATASCLYTAPASGQACMTSFNSNSTSSIRPQITFAGNTAPAITSVSWSDGTSTVGTGNPLTVNPTTTTTYTASITAAGCIVSPAPTATINVNPLPLAVTAVNSAQCGTQIPTASIASTTGAINPTFKWYDAATGGNVMQNSTSTTYTSNVATTTTFYVSEVNATTGCESPRTAVTVTVATADGIAAATSNATICIGQSITLTASNTNPTPLQSYVYTWTGTANSGVTSTTGTSITVTPTQPGSYTYNLSGVDGGCNAVASVSVTVNPFVATVTPVDATCNGVANGSFTLTSSSCGTLPYTYSIDGGANFGSIPTNLAAGAYTVIVKDANNYVTTGQSITIGQPSITITNPTVTNAAVCVNGTSAQVGAAASVSIPTPGSVTVTFGLASQPTEVSGASSFPTVAASPNIIMTATMPALPAGATVTGANFTFPGLTALGGSWRSDMGFGFTGAVTAGYASGTGAPNSSGVYDYIRTLTAGTINPAGGALNVHYYDLYNDNTGAEATFPTSSSVATLTINYTTPTPATISWWDAPTGGNQIGTGSAFETVGTSILPNTNTTGVVTLYAQGQNGACPSPGRTAATVTVNALPIVNAGADFAVCAGQTATLAGTGASTYAWTGGINNNVAFTPSSTATFTVTGTDANGCTNTDDILVTVNALPIVSAGVDQTICFGEQVTLNGSGATSYNWNNNVVNGVAFAPNNTTTYIVTGTDANNCSNNDTTLVTVNALPTVDAGSNQTVCFGDTVTLFGNGAVTYSWNNNVTDSIGFVANTTTTYTVTGTDANGCVNSDNVTVFVNALPVVNAGTDLVVCQNGQATVNASGAQTYVWSNNVQNNLPFAVPTTITLTVTGIDANGCIDTDDITITASPLPTIDAGSNIVQCGDQNVTLTATGATYYTWNNGVQNGVTFNAPFGVTSYIVTGVDTLGCSGSDVVNVTINEVPTATVTAANALTLVASPSNGTFQWIDCATNTPILGATSSTFTASENGSYAVIVTTGAGCADTSDCAIIDEVGLDNLDMTRGVTIYPNPTTENVTVTVSNLSNVSATIFDAQGKLITTVTTVENGSIIELSTLQPGVYMIQLSAENYSTIERIVKN